jgi:hypothetical protein
MRKGFIGRLGLKLEVTNVASAELWLPTAGILICANIAAGWVVPGRAPIAPHSAVRSS